eukprot:473990_1
MGHVLFDTFHHDVWTIHDEHDAIYGVTLYEFEILDIIEGRMNKSYLLLCNIENGQCNDRFFDLGYRNTPDMDSMSNDNRWWAVSVYEFKRNNLCHVIEEAVDGNTSTMTIDYCMRFIPMSINITECCC